MTIRDEAFLGNPISAFVIDAHTHISPYYFRGWYETPSETSNQAITESIDRLGINCIVTAPHPLIVGMMREANETALEAIREFSGLIYGYIGICPAEGPEAVRSELVKYAGNPGFLGIKFLPGGYHGDLSQKEYRYAADFAVERDCPVLIHTWGNRPPLSDIEDFAEQYPHMKLICAHQGGGTSELSLKLAEIMKRHPNIYTDTSGSLSNTLAIEDMVQLFGEDRIIFGSDLINLDPRYDFGRVVLSPLSDEIKKKILSYNFLSLLRTSQMGRIEAGNRQNGN